MATLNRVLIMGNLGADPELRHTASGTPVTTLSVATTHGFNDRDGKHQESTEWHKVVVWSKQAELCAQYLTKGRAVFVEGRIATRSWDDQAGEKKYQTEIIATTVQFLGGQQSPLTRVLDDGPRGAESVGDGDGKKSAVRAFGGNRSTASTTINSRAKGRRTAHLGAATAAPLDASELEDLPF